MKVFNQGGNIWKVYDLTLAPGRFTEIPEKYEEHVANLMKRYPNDLVTDDTAKKAGHAKDERIKALEAENTQLKEQVGKLRAMLSGETKVGNFVDNLGNDKVETPPEPKKAKK